MKAAIMRHYGKIEVIEQKELCSPEKNEVLIKIKAAGICGTDIHGYTGTHPFIKPPRIMGHELAGEVQDVGPAVKGLKNGDRVVVDPVISCGSCYACLKGRNNICSTVKCLGVHMDGGFCNYIKIAESNVYKFSDNIPWEHAALIEPFSIACQVCERSEVKPGEKAAIIGAGPIGICILQAFKRIGADVLIADIIDSRLNLAEKLGASRTVNVKKESLVDAVLDFTGGDGASLVIEAVGNHVLLENSFEFVSPGARLVVLGFNQEPSKIPEIEITKKELEIRGSRLNSHKFPEVIKWFEKKEIDPQPMISRVYPLEAIDEAFKDILKNPHDFCKIVISF